MTLSKSLALADLVDDFSKEIREIESVFTRYVGHRTVAGYQYTYIPLDDGCLISLWDAWSRFIRRLVVTCAGVPTTGLSGALYTPPTPRNEAQVIGDLLSNNRRGNNFGIANGEPKWSGIRNLTDIVSFLALPNANTIVSAISSNAIQLGFISVQNPLEEIRKCRNYVAHKSPPTLTDVQQYASGGYVDFSSHIRRKRSGVEVFSEWCESLEALGGAASQ